jgi:hypothetical protein
VQFFGNEAAELPVPKNRGFDRNIPPLPRISQNSRMRDLSLFIRANPCHLWLHFFGGGFVALCSLAANVFFWAVMREFRATA